VNSIILRKYGKQDLPIIDQTAFAFSVEKNKALDADCTDYLIKPIDPDELLKMIRNYL
jgi:CheY-like chemotaxis protein